jgi:hypothetical protein
MAERELMTNLAATPAELDDEDLRNPTRMRELLDSEAEWELLVRYGQRAGRLALAQALGPSASGRISLSSRGLSNNEINRCLSRLRDIIDLAREECGVEIGDPTRKRNLPRTDPPGSWLLPFQLEAVFDAADELDRRRNAGPDYRSLGRRALVELLGLGGPRVSEVGKRPLARPAPGRRRLLPDPRGEDLSRSPRPPPPPDGLCIAPCAPRGCPPVRRGLHLRDGIWHTSGPPLHPDAHARAGSCPRC